MRTAIQEAFIRINNPPPLIKEAVSKLIRKEAKAPLRMWNANLSYRTFHDLKAAGIMTA